MDLVARLASEVSALRREAVALSKNKQLEPQVRAALTRAQTSLAQAEAEITEVL